MMDIYEIPETWTTRLSLNLDRFAKEVIESYNFIEYSLEGNSNTAFLLRAYLAFRRKADIDGNEVAITVDVQAGGLKFTISSDVCYDTGAIIADGPSEEKSLAEDFDLDEALNKWMDEFSGFLIDARELVFSAISHL